MKSNELMQVIMREPEGSAKALAAAEALIKNQTLNLFQNMERSLSKNA